MKKNFFVKPFFALLAAYKDKEVVVTISSCLDNCLGGVRFPSWLIVYTQRKQVCKQTLKKQHLLNYYFYIYEIFLHNLLTCSFLVAIKQWWDLHLFRCTKNVRSTYQYMVSCIWISKKLYVNIWIYQMMHVDFLKIASGFFESCIWMW